jgi:hypothetical protein
VDETIDRRFRHPQNGLKVVVEDQPIGDRRHGQQTTDDQHDVTRSSARQPRLQSLVSHGVQPALTGALCADNEQGATLTLRIDAVERDSKDAEQKPRSRAARLRRFTDLGY